MHFQSDSTEVRWAVELNALTTSWRAARAVQAAVRVHLAAALARPATGDQKGHRVVDLAELLSLDPQRTEQLLVVLAAMDLASRIPVSGQRAEDQWQLSPRGQALLDPASHFYQGDILTHSGNMGGIWDSLEDVLRGRPGARVFSADAQPPRMDHRAWIMAMQNIAIGGRGAALAERVDLSGCRTLADVGGGPGGFAMALCERYPQLQAVVMDLPQTLEIAHETISRLGKQDRVSTRPCDWNQDNFGHDNDALLLSNVLHGGESDTAMKLGKAFRAMAPGGRLVIQDFLLNRERTGPLSAALFAIMVGAWSVDELRSMVAAAGFVDLQDEPMPPGMDTHLITARKPS